MHGVSNQGKVVSGTITFGRIWPLALLWRESGNSLVFMHEVNGQEKITSQTTILVERGSRPIRLQDSLIVNLSGKN